jgi:hypothetical protein
MGTRRGGLGEAQARITLDTTPLQAGVMQVRRIGQEARSSLGSASQSVDEFIGKFRSGGSSVRSFGQSIKQVSAGIRSMRGELAAVGLAAGALTKIGLSAAAS